MKNVLKAVNVPAGLTPENLIKWIALTILFGLMAACLAGLIYVKVTSIDFRTEPVTVTEIGQCVTDSLDKTICIQRAGETVTKTNFPVIEGTLLQRECVYNINETVQCKDFWVMYEPGHWNYAKARAYRELKYR